MAAAHKAPELHFEGKQGSVSRMTMYSPELNETFP